MRKLIYILISLFCVITSANALRINEVLVANTYTNYDPTYKEFSSWIEIYNESSHSVDIGGYYLSDDIKNPTKWKIPSTTIGANGYLLIWADERNSGLHTNFKLKTSGEDIVLADRNGNIIESANYPEQKSDISFSIQNGKIVYTEPTPNYSNSTAYEDLDRSKKPKFSLDSGFYDSQITVELTQKNGTVIYYTTDGSIPTKNSKVYTNPIKLNKTTVIRARALEKGKFLSGIKNRTYLLNEKITLPVVSIALDAKYLNDDKIGIYKNYKEDWMRAGSVEYIKDGKSQFSENVGIRINGDKSREKAQKSMSIYAKDKFGEKEIDYPLFPDKPQIKKVKSFVLRNSGNDWEWTMMRDGLFHTLAREMGNIDYLSYHPTVVFLNGKYWGVLNLREKPNEDYIVANHGFDANKMDLLFGGQILALRGNNLAYKKLLNYINSSPINNQNTYSYISSQVDLDELMNYEIMQIFIGNSDWPWKNIKYYKQYKDGAKWRWILYDTDFGFGTMNEDTVNTNTFQRAVVGSPANEIYTKLLNNDVFKNRFVSKFTTYLNTIFEPENINNLITKLKDKIAPEMKRHFDFWGQFHWTSYSNWQPSIDKLYEFSNARNSVVKSQLRDRFLLSGNHSLRITKASHGSTFIDGVRLNDDFQGDYFDNAKVELKANADNGYTFEKWSDGSTQVKRSLTINSNKTIEAFFRKKQSHTLNKVVITEINYKSADDFDVGDWIELYNNDTKDIDLSSWVVEDDKDDQPFIISEGTILKKGKYLVISEDKNTFNNFFPEVKNVIGNFKFGLGKKSDKVRVFDNMENLVDIVSYKKGWADAKGNGKTLALTDVNSDNSIMDNWIASDNHGTPAQKNRVNTLKSETIKLKTGWNLMGANSNLSLEQLQEKIAFDNLLIIQGPVKVYKKENIDNNQEFLNDFTHFEDGKGYWIKLLHDKSFEFTPKTSAITISLSKGWNLINPPKEMSLENIKVQIGEENLLVIQGPNKVYKKENIDNNQDFLNDFEKFEEPKGYWIKVKSSVELDF